MHEVSRRPKAAVAGPLRPNRRIRPIAVTSSRCLTRVDTGSACIHAARCPRLSARYRAVAPMCKTSSTGPGKSANGTLGIAASPLVQRQPLSGSNSWNPSTSDAPFALISLSRAPWLATIRCSATPSRRGSRASPSSCGAAARETMRTVSGRRRSRNTCRSPCRCATSTRCPLANKCRSGSSVSGAPGRGPARSSNRRQAASTTGPPVSTGANGCSGGRPQPVLAL